MKWLNLLHDNILKYFVIYAELIKESKNLPYDNNVFQNYHWKSFEDKAYITICIAGNLNDPIRRQSGGVVQGAGLRKIWEES